jgi:hypothetical protein
MPPSRFHGSINIALFGASGILRLYSLDGFGNAFHESAFIGLIVDDAGYVARLVLVVGANELALGHAVRRDYPGDVEQDLGVAKGHE